MDKQRKRQTKEKTNKGKDKQRKRQTKEKTNKGKDKLRRKSEQRENKTIWKTKRKKHNKTALMQ